MRGGREILTERSCACARVCVCVCVCAHVRRDATPASSCLYLSYGCAHESVHTQERRLARLGQLVATWRGGGGGGIRGVR